MRGTTCSDQNTIQWDLELIVARRTCAEDVKQRIISSRHLSAREVLFERKNKELCETTNQITYDSTCFSVPENKIPFMNQNYQSHIPPNYTKSSIIIKNKHNQIIFSMDPILQHHCTLFTLL